MPTPVTLSFTQLTNDTVAFANKAAWNAYFNNVQFTLAAANLPVATLADVGAVMMAANNAATTITWTAQTYGSDYYTPVTMIDTSGNTYTTNVATKDSFDKLLINVNQLKSLYDTLVTKLIAAGVMSAS